MSSQLWKGILSVIAISLHPIVNTSPDVMCNQVSVYCAYHTLTPEICWSSVATFTSTLHSYWAKAPGEIGMLGMLCGRFKVFWKSKIGKKREAGLEVSNVGRFNPSGKVQYDVKNGMLTMWYLHSLILLQTWP